MPDPQHDKGEPGYFTVTEAAAYLNVDRRTILYFIKRGKLKAGEDYKKDLDSKYSTFIYRIAKPAIFRLAQDTEDHVGRLLHDPPVSPTPEPLQPPPPPKQSPPTTTPTESSPTKADLIQAEAGKWKGQYLIEREWRQDLQKHNTDLSTNNGELWNLLHHAEKQIESLEQKLKLLPPVRVFRDTGPNPPSDA